MPPTIQVGTVLINGSLLLTQLFGLNSEVCSGDWSTVMKLDGPALDRKINAVGWNFFFMAPEVKVMFLGAIGAKKIQSALMRILEKVKRQSFNSLEITGIVAKRFLGIPYITVSAHSRHIQRTCRLEDANARRVSQHANEWARG